MSKTATNKNVLVKDSDLKNVIAALEQDLSQAFEAAKPGMLAKADDGSKDSKPPESSDDSATPPSDSSASPAPDASAAPAPSPAPDAAATPSPDASAAAPGAAPSADPAAQQPQLTPEALQAEYAQLAPEELDMHIQAALAAKDALAASAGAAPGGAPAGMPPAAAASPAPASPAGSPPPAMKAEVSMTPAENTGGVPSSHAKANGGKINKSEDDAQVAALKAEVQTMRKAMEDMKKSAAEDVENLTKITKMVLEQPVRKAVTSIGSIEYLKKAEVPAPAPKKEFTAAEAKAKLTELIPSLSKSERDLLVKFTVGKATLAEMTPVLEKHLK